jgi:hypothetical protein
MWRSGRPRVGTEGVYKEREKLCEEEEAVLDKLKEAEPKNKTVVAPCL